MKQSAKYVINEKSFLTENPSYFNIYKRRELQLFKCELQQLKETIHPQKNTLVFLCIGSDRATGDCFGPLIGETLSHSLLKRKPSFSLPKIYGTLDKPIHAINLEKTIRSIYKRYANPYIIAIDASLGIKEHIGYITLGKGPLFPGIGVKKELPKIGDTAITGIVNTNTGKGQNTLQTTRLSTVYHLANFTSQGLIETFFPSTDVPLHSESH